jgi:hydrogenase expression/formation protein HypE
VNDCPIPRSSYDQVLLGHGSGGRLTSELIERLFLPAFGNETLSRLEDQATLRVGPAGARLAFSTDSFVVRPLFFPGGDIGSLAVNGTVNDLAVGGAQARFLSAAFILEEGLPMADLQRIVASMRQACAAAGVQLVTGDTKVVDRGKGDGVFITTSGIGVVPPGRELSIAAGRPGDRVLVSGPIGDHGIAILSAREGLEFETALVSDTVSLHDLTAALLEAGLAIRCMRDPTRGGLAGAVHDLARGSRVGVRLQETAIPVRPEVHAACEMLGLDPLHVACEGRLMAVVAAADCERALGILHSHPKGAGAAAIGELVADEPGLVVMTSTLGSTRLVTPLLGEQLPRIC